MSPPLSSIIREYRMRVTYLGKDQNSNCACTECVSLLHHGKVKKSLGQTILSWGGSVWLITTPRVNWRRASDKPNLTTETFFVPSQLWHQCCKHVLQECGFPSSSSPPHQGLMPGSDTLASCLGRLTFSSVADFFLAYVICTFHIVQQGILVKVETQTVHTESF